MIPGILLEYSNINFVYIEQNGTCVFTVYNTCNATIIVNIITIIISI